MGVMHHGLSSRRRPPVAAAWTIGGLGTALVLAGLVDVLLGDGTAGTLGRVRHIAVFVLATALVTRRAATMRSGRRIWVAFALGAAVNTVAEALSVFAYDGEATGVAGVLYGFAYLAIAVGLSFFLRRRVGDALRTFSLDVLGIALAVGTALSTVLLVPMIRHGSAPTDATLSLLFTSADLAIACVLGAVASFTGRRRGGQDRLLAVALLVMCAGDFGDVLALTGWIGTSRPWVQLLWESSMLLLAAAAWARPAPAGALRVGGWWESTPTLWWLTAGTGGLLAAWRFDLPGQTVALATATIVLAGLRGRRVVREVRDLVVVRAESLVDELTGLANQRALFSELELLTREGGADGRRAALMICHLEGFDELTDTLGHEAADELLRAVAARLGPVAPGALARLNGDEFATIVEDADPPVVAAALEAALVLPVSMDGIAVTLRPVFGYARFPQDATTPAGLARRADVARRDAKARGLDVVAYDPARDHHSRERLELAGDLRAALDRCPDASDGLWLAFQPQVELSGGAVCGVEALIRWRHPTRGELSPADLLPIAERSGQMSALTDWVVDRAIAEVAALRAAGHDLHVSVNVSAVTLVDVGLPARIAAALARHEVPGAALVVEVTEDAVMRDHRRCLAVLREIAELGVEISVDDFGTGQSSLAQLRHLPADEIKIDRSFVCGMLDDPLDAELVHMVITLGRRMGVRVVAEGIETAEQRAVLARLDCDLIQGFGVGRPMASAELRPWLAARLQPVRA
jgi:diguanylate cyclase (GGDEF)-like protein